MRKYEGCDVYKFMESLKYRPETYKTILLDNFNNKSTETSKVRRKISTFVRQGLIASGLLDGCKESGTKIFYSLDKKYYIIITYDNQYNYYYCSNVDVNKGEEIAMYNSFILKDFEWEYLGNIGIDKKFIVRWF